MNLILLAANEDIGDYIQTFKSRNILDHKKINPPYISIHSSTGLHIYSRRWISNSYLN